MAVSRRGSANCAGRVSVDPRPRCATSPHRQPTASTGLRQVEPGPRTGSRPTGEPPSSRGPCRNAPPASALRSSRRDLSSRRSTQHHRANGWEPARLLTLMIYPAPHRRSAGRAARQQKKALSRLVPITSRQSSTDSSASSWNRATPAFLMRMPSPPNYLNRVLDCPLGLGGVADVSLHRFNPAGITVRTRRVGQQVAGLRQRIG